MKTCFNSKFIITQVFGNEFIYQGNPYYARYGLKGHNGLDIKPTGSNLSIFNILLGEIVVLGFNNTYGFRCGIWNREKNLYECHNHLSFLNPSLEIGQILDEATYLGKMGNTGFSLGAHNHYAMAQVDKRCRRINFDNGYKGWIDPMPFLQELD